MVEINVPVILVQAITFILGMILVWNTMIKALMKTMKDRHDYIAGTLDKIEKDKADMETMKLDYEKKIKDAQEQAASMVSKAVAEGEKIKSGIVDEARAEGAKLISAAKAEIETEKKKAIEDVKDTIVDISIMAAEKAIRKKISKKDQLGVVSKYMKEIEKSNN